MSAIATAPITIETVQAGDSIHERCLTVVDGETTHVLVPVKVTYVGEGLILGRIKGGRKERLIFNPVFDA